MQTDECGNEALKCPARSVFRIDGDETQRRAVGGLLTIMEEAYTYFQFTTTCNSMHLLLSHFCSFGLTCLLRASRKKMLSPDLVLMHAPCAGASSASDWLVVFEAVCMTITCSPRHSGNVATIPWYRESPTSRTFWGRLFEDFHCFAVFTNSTSANHPMPTCVLSTFVNTCAFKQL